MQQLPRLSRGNHGDPPNSGRGLGTGFFLVFFWMDGPLTECRDNHGDPPNPGRVSSYTIFKKLLDDHGDPSNSGHENHLIVY